MGHEAGLRLVVASSLIGLTCQSLEYSNAHNAKRVQFGLAPMRRDERLEMVASQVPTLLTLPPGVNKCFYLRTTLSRSLPRTACLSACLNPCTPPCPTSCPIVCPTLMSIFVACSTPSRSAHRAVSSKPALPQRDSACASDRSADIFPRARRNMPTANAEDLPQCEGAQRRVSSRAFRCTP